MNPCLNLQDLLTRVGCDQRVITCDLKGAGVTESQWMNWVSCIEQQVAWYQTSANPQPSAAWAVYCEDAAFAGAALFALWRLGLTAWMPGNIASDTCAALDRDVGGWISDVAINTPHPLIDVGTAIKATLPGPLDICRANASTRRLPTDIVLYVYTSGSSGAPKAISKTFAQLQAELDNLQALWGKRIANTTLMASVSHQHFYGLLFRLLWPLCNGTVFLREAIQYPEQWFAATQRFHPVSWVASPALYKRMQALLPWAELRLHIALMFCSGGPLPGETAVFLQTELQQPVIEVFGSSETGGVGWRAAMTDTAHSEGAWTCFAGVEVSLSREGALMIQSGYLPDSTPYEMGDAARLLGNHRFVLAGRLDRIVKIEEKRVSLPQLEQHLLQHPWVQDAYVLPLTPPGGRQSLGAVITLRADVPVVLGCSANPDLSIGNRKQLVDTLRQHMAHLCEAVIVPKKWRFVAEIPVNAQGKRQTATLAALFDSPERILLPEVLHLEHINANEAKLILAVPAKLTYFSGHFDKAPILPGVVQLEWAWKMALTCWPLPQTFSDLEVLKFQRVIVPMQLLQLSLRYDAVKEKLYFHYHSSKGVHSSGRIVLKNTHSVAPGGEA